MLIPSLPSLSQPLGLPVCLTRFPAARLFGGHRQPKKLGGFVLMKEIRCDLWRKTMNMLENATFAAALVAAFVSLLNAMYNKRNASDLENLKVQLQQGLDKLRDRLERERQLEGFNRERITNHLNQIFDAFVEISLLAEISGKTR